MSGFRFNRRQMRPSWEEDFNGNLRPRVALLDGGYLGAPVPPGFEATQVPRGAQKISVFEEVSPLSGSGQFGRRFQGQYPQTVDLDDALDIFSNDGFPGPPRPIAFHLYRSDIATEQVGSNCAIRAEITYSCGGIQNEFSCDWVNGGQFSLVCSTVRILGRGYAPRPAAAYNPDVSDSIILGAMCGLEAAAPSGQALTFTTTIDEMTGAGPGASNFQVPDFARTFVVNALNDSTTRPLSTADLANFILVFAGPGGTVLKILPMSQEIMRDAVGTIIPGGTTLITVLRISAFADTVAWSLTFQLGL